MEKLNNLDRVAVSVEEAGKLLGVSRSVAYSLARSAGFPVLKLGKRKLVSLRGLQAWIDEQTAKGAGD